MNILGMNDYKMIQIHTSEPVNNEGKQSQKLSDKIVYGSFPQILSHTVLGSNYKGHCYFIMLANDIIGRCSRSGIWGCTFPPIFR